MTLMTKIMVLFVNELLNTPPDATIVFTNDDCFISVVIPVLNLFLPSHDVL